MLPKRLLRFDSTVEPASPLVRLWLLRMLVPMGAQNRFITREGFECVRVAHAVGIGHWADVDCGEFKPAAIKLELRQTHEQTEANFADQNPLDSLPICLANNIQRLSDLVGLNPVDRDILAFVVNLHTERVLDDTADWLGAMSSAKVFHTLAGLLHRPLNQVRDALSTNGVLARSGLVTLDRRSNGQMRQKIDLLSDGFADLVISQDSDPISLLRDVVRQSTPPELSVDDYPHLDTALSVLIPYLRQAVQSGRPGVNIFLHGAPGTGKSQLVKVLAKLADTELFEVASEDNEGESVSGTRRLRAYRASQSFFLNKRTCILFDEVEDVFNDEDHGVTRSTAQSRKAWINRILEENPVPSFWLSNSIDCLDPAFIRRFDMVLEVPVPSKSQRERILARHCLDLLDVRDLKRVATCDELAPAVISRAASVVHTIQSTLGPQKSAEAFEFLINNTLKAQGHKTIQKEATTNPQELYDPQFICADTDLADVARRIAGVKSGRMCLFGPPGTGKTAFGHWLADQLGMPLHLKRASDLVSKYIGETEQNMARAFSEAEQEGALLQIDEVDSFLQDRQGAQRSWEVSQVNEMLTQMESFTGVFIASTNLMAQLDQAALRRFDLKVKFDYLNAYQASELFRRYCVRLNLPCDQGGSEWSAALERLQRLIVLTPGDFATVDRQSRLSPVRTPFELVAALEKECAVKASSRSSSIGFLS